jgi:signal transduction histidine kinase
MLREEAGRADRFSTFIDQVAMSNHDIRNTLTIAIGNTSLMERLISEDPSEEDLKKATQKIRKSLSVLSAHMRSMAELSQQQLMVDREMETVEIVSLIETIVDSIRPRFENVNISIEVTALRKNITAPVSGGIVSARRMLDNLLINACEGNGVVTAKNIQLHIIETTDSVEIRVKDDGPGFSESQLATRNQAFKTTKPRGTGLGLYTSEQLVLASGGLLERMNNPSGGATVSIKLPKAAPV